MRPYKGYICLKILSGNQILLKNVVYMRRSRGISNLERWIHRGILWEKKKIRHNFRGEALGNRVPIAREASSSSLARYFWRKVDEKGRQNRASMKNLKLVIISYGGQHSWISGERHCDRSKIRVKLTSQNFPRNSTVCYFVRINRQGFKKRTQTPRFSGDRLETSDPHEICR